MHGFSATRDEQLASYGDRFAGAGLASVIFDFRHIGSSSGTPRQLIDLRRQYEDCDAALGFARGLPGVDPERVAVWGTSFAGGHALDAAARHSWLAAAVCQTPFLDGKVPAPGMTRSKLAWLTASALRDRLHARLGRPPYLVPVLGAPGTRAVFTTPDVWAGYQRVVGENTLWRNEVAARVLLDLPKHRPVKQAPLVRCPVLIQIVGDDTVVRSEPAIRAAEQAADATLERYPGLHHFDVYVGEGFERLCADQLEFLEQHLL